MRVISQIRSVWSPSMYHGWLKEKGYFEGWYVKLVNESSTSSLAIIPGISMDSQGNRKAFIQVLDGISAHSTFHAFPFSDFRADPARFAVSIADNFFSHDEMHLNLPEIKGAITFQNHFLWPWRPYAPGVMGWYSFVPLMQCYHGVVSMDHDLSGSLVMGGKEISMDGGKGYMEKDWGRSFPRCWVWTQCNHFKENPGTSVMFSIAHIPWLRSYFIGFLAGLKYNGKLYRFATYNNSKASIKIKNDQVVIHITRKNITLHIIATQAPGADLRSPISGAMAGKVNESMQAKLHVRFFKNEKLIFENTGTCAGLEVAGDTDILENNG